MDTRYAPSLINNQNTDEQYGTLLRNYVEGQPQTQGYCTFQNPQMPFTNHGICGSNQDIGWLITFQFTEDVDVNYKIRWGTDFGRGSSIYVNNIFQKAYQPQQNVDMYWYSNWDSEFVFHLDYDFTPGQNVVYIVGQEECCDGDMSITFSRNGQDFVTMTQDNLDCAQNNNCPGVSCNSNQWQNGANCEACSYKCSTCENSSSNCLTCSHNTRDYNLQCDCLEGYFEQSNQIQCNQCSTVCKSCSSYSFCTSCNSGYYQENNTCYQCSQKYGNICGTCDSQECKTCSNNPSSMVLPDCISSDCQIQQWQDGQICRNCINNCQFCDNSTDCITCQDGYFKNDQNLCQQCQYPCQNCSSLQNCQTCQEQHFDPQFDCTQCIQGGFQNNNQCYLCQNDFGNHCETCNSNECLTCSNNQNFTLPNCINTNCEQNQWQDGQICRQCHNSCQTCQNSSLSDCLSCQDGYYLTNNNQCNSCQLPCQNCSSQQICLSCSQDRYDVQTNCQQCIQTAFLNSQSECVPCSQQYGQVCKSCDQQKCLTCIDQPDYLRPPLCISNTCNPNEYEDGMACIQCMQLCATCQNNISCTSCIDTKYLENGQCLNCVSPCYICESLNICILCDTIGFQPPLCNECTNGFFKNQQGDCINNCGIGFYGDTQDNSCKQCYETCFTCSGGFEEQCTSCPNLQYLQDGKCVDCNSAIGFEQDPFEAIGVCREICGDGIRLTDKYECDDGNQLNNDGCNKDCQIEEGWNCSGGGQYDKDVCIDKRPIGFNISFQDKLYLNIEENLPMQMNINFNKTFTLPQGKQLKDYIQVSIPGLLLPNLQLEVLETNNKRNLKASLPIFEVLINFGTTVKNRYIQIDLSPKSDFDDGNGNTLADEKPKKADVQEYYYYSQEERQTNDKFQMGMFIGILILMGFLPFYVFIYKNHFNRFYVLFFIIDIVQTLYYYRFVNIRWPINGVLFFQNLKPVISFYMANFYYQEITQDNFNDFKTGIQKFDYEGEVALFQNNVGSLLTLFYILIIGYIISYIFTIKKFYKDTQNSKIYKIFYELRFGYYEWGIMFDCLCAASGVFIISIFIQLTNITDTLNIALVLFVGIFYFGFFGYALYYTKKNLNNLYTVYNEYSEEMTTEEKILKNNTFKFRNIWHFIEGLHLSPRKAYFFFVFISRKILTAITILTLSTYPKLQLSIFAFCHVFVMFLIIKYKFFKENRESLRMLLSEFFVLTGVCCMYYLLDDESEDEPARMKYCWIILCNWLFSLFLLFCFFVYQEIWLKRNFSCLSKKQQQKRIQDIKIVKSVREQRKRKNKVFDEQIQQDQIQNEQYNQDIQQNNILSYNDNTYKQQSDINVKNIMIQTTSSVNSQYFQSPFQTRLLKNSPELLKEIGQQNNQMDSIDDNLSDFSINSPNKSIQQRKRKRKQVNNCDETWKSSYDNSPQRSPISSQFDINSELDSNRQVIGNSQFKNFVENQYSENQQDNQQLSNNTTQQTRVRRPVAKIKRNFDNM